LQHASNTPITHSVAPKGNALQCTNCHSGGQMNFAALGCTLKGSANIVCTQCHKLKDEQLTFTE
jgi:hypothetical protein